MSVTIDDRRLETEQLGLQTVGQVLSLLKRDNRVVVQVLIDGQEPDLDRISHVRAAPLLGHTLYIETADPREMAAECLKEVATQLDEADRLKGESVELLRTSQQSKAMEKLSGCFTTWQHAQQSILKTAQLLKIDLETIRVEAQSLTELLGLFTAQLKQIRSALEQRDFVGLTDILAYETTETSRRWKLAVGVLLGTIKVA